MFYLIYVRRVNGIKTFCNARRLFSSISRSQKPCFQAKGDGGEQTTLDIDFYVDKDMIHISDTKIARHYGDYYVQQIIKLRESNRLILSRVLSHVQSSQ